MGKFLVCEIHPGNGRPTGLAFVEEAETLGEAEALRVFPDGGWREGTAFEMLDGETEEQAWERLTYVDGLGFCYFKAWDIPF